MSCSDFVKADSTTESFQDELMDDLTLEDETFEEGNVVILGVCAMNKKINSAGSCAILSLTVDNVHNLVENYFANGVLSGVQCQESGSVTMKMMVNRLAEHPNLNVIVFDEDTILNKPIEAWPTCHCLLSFFSLGFPLDKAIAYWNLRKSMLINDLQAQHDLLDRRNVHRILCNAGVPVPRYAVLNRYENNLQDDTYWKEEDDSLQVADTIFHKPFVEKPVSAEDHNVRIYYPSADGGGSQQLFRKVKDRSSRYSRENCIRKKGSYLYEDFVATDGTDVKVYTVGPNYAHAEARKSPGLDGKVERNSAGKEVRHPVVLNAAEKLIARKVSEAFKQTVCGFDLLRANGKSYVCDVNGFSLVTNSRKYNEDCAQILLEMIFSKLAPEVFPSILPSVEYLAEEVPVPIHTTESGMELRCVIAVVRHADRTPKQKMKMLTTHERFIKLVEKHEISKKGEIKFKSPKHLQEVLDITRDLLEEAKSNPSEFGDAPSEVVRKLKTAKSVLEMYGHFSGINRKVQFKYVKSLNGHSEAGKTLLMILKWGGEITPDGEKQAEEFGTAFRCIYPDGEGEYGSLPGSGFLRLHSTYRHDLKVYASDEGRVQTTAAAFTKGLLDLDGTLVSTLFHLVRTNNMYSLLDNSHTTKETTARTRRKLHNHIHTPGTVENTKLAATKTESLLNAMEAIEGHPLKACETLYTTLQQFVSQLIGLLGHNIRLYNNESFQLFIERWQKLEKDFKHNDGKFDISKIPDIYDCIKYDMLHNSHLGLKVAHDLYIQSMHLADLVMPQEYGITREEKLEIASRICSPLLSKIQTDISNTLLDSTSDVINRLDPKLSSGVTTPTRHVRTRLYFTSNSHIQSMFNLLQHGGLCKPSHPEWSEASKILGATSELNYMAQIVFLLFEDKQEPEDSEDRYKVEVHFTPGGKGREEIVTGSESTSSSTESLKADISKTLLYTSLKRMVPENKQRQCHQLSIPIPRPGAKNSCVLPLDVTHTVKKVKSKSLPSLFYVSPSIHCHHPEERASFSQPIDITQQPIPEASLRDLQDSPVDEKQLPLKIKNGPSISVQPLQRLFTLPLREVTSFLETVPIHNQCD